MLPFVLPRLARQTNPGAGHLCFRFSFFFLLFSSSPSCFALLCLLVEWNATSGAQQGYSVTAAHHMAGHRVAPVDYWTFRKCASIFPTAGKIGNRKAMAAIRIQDIETYLGKDHGCVLIAAVMTE